MHENIPITPLYPTGWFKPIWTDWQHVGLLRNHTPWLFYEQLFLEWVTENIRIQLVDTKFKNHCELARSADILWYSHNKPVGEPLITHARQHKSLRFRFQPNLLLPPHLRWCSKGVQTATHTVRKRQGQSLVASVTGYDNSLLFFHDSVSKRPFLVDTGEEVSVLLGTALDTCMKQPGQSPWAANGSSIHTNETRKVPLHLASNTYQWNFIVAEVTHPLLGVII